MKQKITGEIDSTYIAHSHSDETLTKWHSQHSQVSDLLMSAQVVFPVLVTLFTVFYFVYLIEFGPNKLGETLNKQADSDCQKELKRESQSTVWIVSIVSIMYTLSNIAVDAAALVEYDKLPTEIETYFNKDSEDHSQEMRSIPKLMIIYDTISLAPFIICPAIVAGYKWKCSKFKWSVLLYTAISPIACLATHAYHIIFAFINNPYHATSVLLLYIMTLFVLVVTLQKIYYSIKTKLGIIICYILAPSLLAVAIGLTIAVLLTVPLNNAIDEASNQIYSIYQASVAVFATLVTWNVLIKKPNSPLTPFTNAANTIYKPEKQHSEKWDKMTEKEKEIHIANAFLSHVNFTFPSEDSELKDRPTTRPRYGTF